MTNFKWAAITIVVLTITTVAETTKAHDGSCPAGSCSRADHSPVDTTGRPLHNRTGNIPYGAVGNRVAYPSSLPTDDNAHCTRGGCCNTTGTCRPSDNVPRSDMLTSVTDRNPFVRLDTLTADLRHAVLAELRNTPDYELLIRNTNEAAHFAGRLRNDAERSAPDSVLLNDARNMLTPLKRMNTVLKQNYPGTQSLHVLQQTGNELVTYGRALQGRVNRSQAQPHSQPYSAPAPPLPPLPPSANSENRPADIPEGMEGIGLLPRNEQTAALRQRICPVTKQPLGSMGKPILVTVSGRSIYVCCEGCVNAVRSAPGKHLP